MNCRRDKLRCDGSRPCASCVRKKCECVERACSACTQEGKSECAHNKSNDMGLSDDRATFRDNEVIGHAQPSPASPHPVPPVVEIRRVHYDDRYTAMPAASPHYQLYSPAEAPTPTSPVQPYFYNHNPSIPHVAVPNSMQIMHDQNSSAYINDSRSRFYPAYQDHFGRYHDRYSLIMDSNSRTILPYHGN